MISTRGAILLRTELAPALEDKAFRFVPEKYACISTYSVTIHVSSNLVRSSFTCVYMMHAAMLRKF